MANVPKKFSQEAQDERDLKASRVGQSPKSRWGWSYSHIRDEDWPFGRKRKKK